MALWFSISVHFGYIWLNVSCFVIFIKQIHFMAQFTTAAHSCQTFGQTRSAYATMSKSCRLRGSRILVGSVNSLNPLQKERICNNGVECVLGFKQEEPNPAVKCSLPRPCMIPGMEQEDKSPAVIYGRLGRICTKSLGWSVVVFAAEQLRNTTSHQLTVT